MTVDHGLGGHDNKKSRQKREKRFKKKEGKASMMMSLPAKKREVVFDEESRLNYLTGFRHRKKERRQYGIAMQVLKDKKSLRDKRPKLGQLVEEDNLVTEKEVKFDDSENEDEEDLSNLGKELDDDNQSNNNPDKDIHYVSEKELKFADECTTSMFGGEVSVTVDTNIAEQLDDASNKFLGTVNGNKTKKTLTALEKAMKKAKNIMHLKIINKNKHVHIKKGDEKKIGNRGSNSSGGMFGGNQKSVGGGGKRGKAGRDKKMPVKGRK